MSIVSTGNPRSSFKRNFIDPLSSKLFTGNVESNFDYLTSQLLDLKDDYVMTKVNPVEGEYLAVCLSGFETDNFSGTSIKPIDAKYLNSGGLRIKIRAFGYHDRWIPDPFVEQNNDRGSTVTANDFIDLHSWAYPDDTKDFVTPGFLSVLKCSNRGGIWYYKTLPSDVTSMLTGKINQSIDSMFANSAPGLMSDFEEAEYVGGNCGGPSSKEDILRTFPKSREVIDELMDLASEMQIDPGWLANAIAGESNFSHTVVNPSSGATGFIQFMPATARAYGTTVEKLASMTAKQQWVYVRRYMIKAKGKVESQIDLSMRIFYPVAMGKGPEFNIAEHWALDGNRYKSYRGSNDEEKKQRAISYFASVNGGIKTKADYYNKIISKKRKKLPDRFC